MGLSTTCPRDAALKVESKTLQRRGFIWFFNLMPTQPRSACRSALLKCTPSIMPKIWWTAENAAFKLKGTDLAIKKGNGAAGVNEAIIRCWRTQRGEHSHFMKTAKDVVFWWNWQYFCCCYFVLFSLVFRSYNKIFVFSHILMWRRFDGNIDVRISFCRDGVV